MARLTRLFILGQSDERIVDQLQGAFAVNQFGQEPFEQLEFKGEELFDEQSQFNSHFRNDLFLILDQQYLDIVNIQYLRQLPANQVIIDNDFSVEDEELQKLFALRNVQRIVTTNFDQMITELKHSFFTGQTGYKFDFDSVEISPEFDGTIEQIGHNYFAIDAVATNQWMETLSWRESLPISPETDWDIWIESDFLNDDTDVEFEVRLVSPMTSEIYYKKIINRNEVLDRHTLTVAKEGGYVSVKMRIKGKHPKFKVGNVHIRQAHSGRGEMMIGGDLIADDQNLNEQVLYYFDAGDMKPPLNVYFSGFREAEGYEGVFMMRDLQGPYLIFGDPRLRGGSFYLGSQEFEQKLINVIKETLDRLGFEQNQVILSGLSMGTFSALYYSSKMQVDWVVVGKPLVNIGVIAANERINRQDEFPTALDVVLKLTGGTSNADMQKANDYFWNSFKAADYSHTGFVFSYMYDDDYDGLAFGQVSKYLHENEPYTRIRHKGLVGRHNDNTSGILSWYLRQYRDILTNEYGRKFEE